MSSWLSILVGQKPGANGDFNPKDTILKLTDRLENATLLEDRRSSLFALKGLARDFKTLVCEFSIDALSKCLRNDSNDLDVAKAVLETLVILVTSSDRKPDEISISVKTSQTFLSNSEHIPVLLRLIEDDDFHLRYDTLSLLSALHQNQPESVVQSIMTSLNGVSKIVDLISEPRDAIRTEALLLLAALTQDHADLQKIVAFENAFEKIFNVISLDYIESISVYDGLQLLLNLLKQNPSNQNLFRETGCIPSLVSYLDSCLPNQEDPLTTTPSDGFSPSNLSIQDWTPQQIKNCKLCLDLFRTLVSTSSANPKLAQTACQQSKFMALLLELGLASYVPSTLQMKALLTLGDVIRGHVNNQSILNESLVYVPLGETQVTQSALAVIVKLAVEGNENELSLRKAALYVVQSFLYNNPEGKLALCMSAMQPRPDELRNDFTSQHPFSTSTLLLPLLDWQFKDEFRTWFASNILSHAIYRNDKSKEVMSGMYLQQIREVDADEDSVSLVQSMAHTLLFLSRTPRAIRSQVAMYSILCCWLWESPSHVSEILQDSSLIQFFIEQVSAFSCDPLLQSLSCFLLSTIYMFDDSPKRSASADTVYSVIKDRVGFDNFEIKLNRLREDKRFLDFGNSTFFDELMIIHITEHFNQILREISISPEDHSKKIVEQEMQSGRMALLEKKVKELQEQLDQQSNAYSAQRNSMESKIQDLEKQLYVSRMSFQALEKEQQDLLRTLTEQDEELHRLRNLLSSFDSNETMMVKPAAIVPPTVPLTSFTSPMAHVPVDFSDLISNSNLEEIKKSPVKVSNPTGIVDI